MTRTNVILFQVAVSVAHLQCLALPTAPNWRVVVQLVAGATQLCHLWVARSNPGRVPGDAHGVADDDDHHHKIPRCWECGGKPKPPGFHHCFACRSCTECMDHHCVWVNNCIGRRNYKKFTAFLFLANILCLLVVSAVLASMVPLCRSLWPEVVADLQKSSSSVGVRLSAESAAAAAAAAAAANGSASFFHPPQPPRQRKKNLLAVADSVAATAAAWTEEGVDHRQAAAPPSVARDDRTLNSNSNRGSSIRNDHTVGVTGRPSPSPSMAAAIPLPQSAHSKNSPVSSSSSSSRLSRLSSSLLTGAAHHNPSPSPPPSYALPLSLPRLSLPRLSLPRLWLRRKRGAKLRGGHRLTVNDNIDNIDNIDNKRQQQQQKWQPPLNKDDDDDDDEESVAAAVQGLRVATVGDPQVNDGVPAIRGGRELDDAAAAAAAAAVRSSSSLSEAATLFPSVAAALSDVDASEEGWERDGGPPLLLPAGAATVTLLVSSSSSSSSSQSAVGVAAAARLLPLATSFVSRASSAAVAGGTRGNSSAYPVSLLERSVPVGDVGGRGAGDGSPSSSSSSSSWRAAGLCLLGVEVCVAIPFLWRAAALQWRWQRSGLALVDRLKMGFLV